MLVILEGLLVGDCYCCLNDDDGGEMEETMVTYILFRARRAMAS